MKRSTVLRVIVVFVIALCISVPSFAAVVDICGFELGDIAAYGEVGCSPCCSQASYPLIQDEFVRSGNYALEVACWRNFGQSNDYIQTAQCRMGEDYNKSTLYTRFYFKYVVKPYSSESNDPAPIFAVCDTHTEYDHGLDEDVVVETMKMHVRIGSDGKLRAYSGKTNSLLGTGTTALNSDQWYRVEVKVGTGSPGTWEIKVDGTSETSGNITTGLTSDYLLFGKANIYPYNPDTNIHCYYDDICVDDAGYPGEGRVLLHRVTGDGTDTTGWTASSGNLWACVDDGPAAVRWDGDFNYGNYISGYWYPYTAVIEDTSDVGITSANVGAVKVFSVCNNSIKLRVRQGATAVNSGVYSNYWTMSVDPTDSSSWTTAKVDSLQIGLAAPNASRQCTALNAMVEYRSASYTPRDEAGIIVFPDGHPGYGSGTTNGWEYDDPNYPGVPYVVPNGYNGGFTSFYSYDVYYNNGTELKESYERTDGWCPYLYDLTGNRGYDSTSVEEQYAPYQIYSFDLDDFETNYGTITKITPFFEGTGDTRGPGDDYYVALYIYNNNTYNWTEVGNGTNAFNDVCIYDDYTSFSSYLDENDCIHLLVFGSEADWWERGGAYTDYLALRILYTPNE